MSHRFGASIILRVVDLQGNASAFSHQDDAAIVAGRAIYTGFCASCHGSSLQGQPDWQSLGADGRYPAPPHTVTGHTWHHSETDLFDYVSLGGRAVLDQMGVAFDSNMPGFADRLNPDHIGSILSFIKAAWPESQRIFQAEATAADIE